MRRKKCVLFWATVHMLVYLKGGKRDLNK